MGHKASSIAKSDDRADDYRASAPRIALTLGLQSWFIIPTRNGDRIAAQVGTCAKPEFQAFVDRCIPTDERGLTLRDLLAGCDYLHVIDRWFSIDTLLLYRCPIELFASKEKALLHQPMRCS